MTLNDYINAYSIEWCGRYCFVKLFPSNSCRGFEKSSFITFYFEALKLKVACKNRNKLIYPDVDCVSTSGHDKRRLQNANGGRSNGVAWCTGDIRWVRNEPLRGGAKHSNARDCLRIEPWLGGGGVISWIPGAGTTFGKPTFKMKHQNVDYLLLNYYWFCDFWMLSGTCSRCKTI